MEIDDQKQLIDQIILYVKATSNLIPSIDAQLKELKATVEKISSSTNLLINKYGDLEKEVNKNQKVLHEGNGTLPLVTRVVILEKDINDLKLNHNKIVESLKGMEKDKIETDKINKQSMVAIVIAILSGVLSVGVKIVEELLGRK